MKRNLLEREFNVLMYTTYLVKYTWIPHRCNICQKWTKEYVVHVASVTCNTHVGLSHQIDAIFYQHHECHNKECMTIECLKGRLGSVKPLIREYAKTILKEHFNNHGLSSDIIGLHRLAEIIAP